MAINAWVITDPTTGKTYPVIAGGSGTETQTPPVDEASGFPDARKTEVHPLEAAAAAEVEAQQREAEAQARFSAADLERARSEERDKLYPQLEKVSTLEEKVQSLTEMLEAQRAEREKVQSAEEAAAQQAAAEEEAKARESMEAKDLITKVESEWQERFNNLQTEYQQQQAVIQKERELQALEQYRAERLAEAQAEVAPQFMDYIVGNTPDEIDASLEVAKNKTAEIVSEFSAAQQQQAQDNQNQLRNAPGVRATAPSTGPIDEQNASRTFSAEDIAKMTPAEYAKHRHLLIPAASNTHRGLFG